ncbi:MAG: hypothetical protein R3B99_05770 [Polyangiales bacterium]
MHRDTFVLLGAQVSAEVLEQAVGEALVEAGHVAIGTEAYERSAGSSARARREAERGVGVGVAASNERAMAELVYPLDLAPALARRIAASSGVEVVLFTLLAEVDAKGGLECTCDERRVDPRGVLVRGRFGDDLERDFGRGAEAPDGRWDDLCDGKPHYAIGALIDTAKAFFFDARELYDVPEPTHLTVYRASSLGVPRLDDLVRRIRAAGGAEVHAMHGRVALRFGPSNATQTAFVKDAELAALSGVLGAVLIDRRSE